MVDSVEKDLDTLDQQHKHAMSASYNIIYIIIIIIVR